MSYEDKISHLHAIAESLHLWQIICETVVGLIVQRSSYLNYY